MNDLQKALVKLYAKGSGKLVQALPEYEALCKAYEGDHSFEGERTRIEELRVYLDESLKVTKSVRQEVDSALRLVWRLRNPIKRELYRALVLEAAGNTWSEGHRTYFAEQSLVLTQARHYFLSFTSRNRSQPNQNLVNANHQQFIRKVIGKARYDSADKSKENLLAVAIDSLLTGSLFDGWFFPKHLGDNSIVEQKLRENCERSLSFVQLVQLEMFYLDAQGPQNWCFFEYGVVKQASIPRVFVQIEEQVPGDNIALTFNDWYAEFSARDAIKLKDTRFYKPAALQENFDSIEKLKTQVRQSLNRIYQNVPD
jgi:hypothetical protein